MIKRLRLYILKYFDFDRIFVLILHKYSYVQRCVGMQ